MRIVATVLSVVALTACGALNNDAKTNKSNVSEEQANVQGAALPAVTIVRVPVGADGKEINDKAEMRVTNAAELSRESVESTFAVSTKAEATVDELDSTSSTASFHGWRRYKRRTTVVCTVNCYTNYNWAFYSPTYYYYGYYYNWDYAQTYSNCGGYNYYQYNRTVTQTYSGYGKAPGYGYPY